MKKVLIILTLMFSTLVYPQMGHISESLRELVCEYISEAEDRGLDTGEHIYNMDYIGFSPFITYPTLGLASRDGKYILMSEYCKLEDIILKAVIFHELSHSIFGEPHCYDCPEDDLMNGVAAKTFYVYLDKKVWDNKLDEMFNRINKRLKE